MVHLSQTLQLMSKKSRLINSSTGQRENIYIFDFKVNFPFNYFQRLKSYTIIYFQSCKSHSWWRWSENTIFAVIVLLPAICVSVTHVFLACNLYLSCMHAIVQYLGLHHFKQPTHDPVIDYKRHTPHILVIFVVCFCEVCFSR